MFYNKKGANNFAQIDQKHEQKHFFANRVLPCDKNRKHILRADII